MCPQTASVPSALLMEHIRVSQCVFVSVCCSGSSWHTQTGWQGGRTVKQGGRGGLSNRVAGEDCQTGWQGGTVAHRQWITEGI